MHGFLSCCLLVLVRYTLIQTVLSAPYLATRNLSSSPLNILPQFSSPITNLHPLNLTHLGKPSGIEYHVPGTVTTLYFHLGFSGKQTSMRNTIISSRDYCEQQIEREGDGPLPKNEDPFYEDLGYGAAINVVSARPDHRLTWGILKDAMEGLWKFLVVDDRYVECEFDVYHGALDLVGRGTIRDAPEAPEIDPSRQSRKREASESSGSI